MNQDSWRAGPVAEQQVVVELLRGGDAAEAYAAVAQRPGIPVGSVGPTRQRALRRLGDDLRVRSLAPA